MRLASLSTYPVKGCHRVEQASALVQPWGLAGDRRWMPVDEQAMVVSQREEPRLTQVRPHWERDARTGVDELVLRSAGHPDLRLPAVPGELMEVRVWGSVLPATLAGDHADAWLSEVIGRKVRLVYLDDPNRRGVDPDYGRPDDRVSFADGYPLLLTNEQSLECLNGWIAGQGGTEGPLPMTRFRPNVVVSGAPAWAEDDWLGRRISIGGIPFRVPKPCDRCVMTTNDQETGQRGREPLRTLGKYRNIDQKLLFGVNLIPDGTGSISLGDEVRVLD